MCVCVCVCVAMRADDSVLCCECAAMQCGAARWPECAGMQLGVWLGGVSALQCNAMRADESVL